MTLAFRTATTADIPLLRELAAVIWRACYAEMISPAQIDYMLGRMYSTAQIAGEIEAGTDWQLAELGAKAIGYLALSATTPPVAELHKLYLLPAFHGHGFGQAMLAQAAALATARGCTELRLRVNKGNPRALRAYERAGFERRESVVEDIGGGFVMDDFVLARPLRGA